MSWKIATFNVNGIRARLPLVLDWLADNRPDLLCLQEIKCREEDFPWEQIEEAGYRASVRGQKGYNGVALVSLDEPEEVVKTFGDGGPEEEARLIGARFGRIKVINTYVPQGKDPADPAFEAKLSFLDRLKSWLSAGFDPDQPLIWTGDLNVAPADIDVFDPKRMEGKIGCHPRERQALEEAASFGLTDLFRELHPEERQFTFWDYRLPKAFERNLGWRLDHFMVSEPLVRAATDCRVDARPRSLPKPSDHTPVWAEFDLGKL